MQNDPLVTGKVLPSSGLLAINCPFCGAPHMHHAKSGLTPTPCGKRYRVRIAGNASGFEESAIRFAIRKAVNREVSR
jgi:hypothetical protein